METVCVIGAGGAGLAAAQALAAREIPFVVHEAGSGIGLELTKVVYIWALTERDPNQVAVFAL